MGRRRLALLLALAVLAPMLVICLGPGLVARSTAGRLASTLHTPVRIGWLTWNPFTGRWLLRRLRIDAVSGPPAFVARRITARLDLWDVLRGRTRVHEVVIDGARLRLRATAAGWRMPIPEAADAEQEAVAWPILQVDWAGAPRARVSLEPAPRVRSSLRLRELEGHASVDAERTRAAFWTRGRLDRSSLAFSGKISSFVDARRLRLRLAASDLDVARVIRLAGTPVADLRGAVSLRAKYEEAGDRKRTRRTASGRLDARDLALRAQNVDAFWARTASVTRFRLDFDQQTAALDAVRLSGAQVWVRQTGAALDVPLTHPTEATEGPSWTVSALSVTGADGAVHLVDAATGDSLLAAAVSHFEAGPVAEAAVPVPFTFEAALSTGGEVTARGEVGRAERSARVHAELDAVVLPPLVPLVKGPLPLESGLASGTVELAVAGTALEGSGSLRVVDLKTIAPDPARPEEVMAFKTLRVTVRRARTDPPEVGLQALEVEWPYVLINRSAAGIFPLSVIPGGSAENGEERRPLALRVERLNILGGRIDFQDTLLTPPYWRSLANVALRAEGVRLPPFHAATLRGNGLVDEIAPFHVQGRIGDRTELEAEYEGVALPPFNAYLAGAAPYAVSSGTVSGRSEIVLERSELDVDNRVVLSRLGLRRQSDEDYLAREIGVPLTLALALMKDYRGNIALHLPFGGDVRAPTFSMRSVVLQAFVRAVRGAVLSPLNALGRVVLQDGRVERFDLDPIPFPPGSRMLDGPGHERVTQIARVLQTHPELRLRVRGTVAEDDLDAVRDEAVLAALGTDPATASLRAYLQARLAGAPPPPIEDEEAARLAAQREGLPFPQEALRTLAVDRGAAAIAAFILEHHVEAAHVTATPPEPPEAGRLAPLPSAEVELHEP